MKNTFILILCCFAFTTDAGWIRNLKDSSTYIVSTKKTKISDTSASTSSTTGALQVFGGAGFKGAINTGNAVSYVKIDSIGGPVLFGNATVWDDIRVITGSFDRPGTSDPSLVSAGNTYLWEFEKNDSGTVQIQFPHEYSAGDTVYIHAHWTSGTRGNEENGVSVGIKVGYSWASIDSVFPAWAVAVLTDTCDGVDWKHQQTQDVAIPGIGKGISSEMFINLKRTDTGDDDTWAGTASGQLPFILEVDVHYPENKLGSASKTHN